MLEKLLSVLKEADRPVSLQDLSQRLSIERSALSGMLDLLVRKGKLELEQPATSEGIDGCEPAYCAGCFKETTCPFITKMPLMYAVKRTEVSDDH